MTDQGIFLDNLLCLGAEATVTSVTGTACPCTAKTGSYSRQWHRDNPTADDCEGTELISRSTATVDVKAFFSNELQTLNTMLNKEILAQIGEIQITDLLMYGTVNTSDGTFYDLSGLDEKQDKITFQSINYVVRHIYDLWTDARVGQVAVLKRKA